MELQWFDIRELTEDAAQTVIGMMDETRRRRVADIAGEDDRKRTIAGELLARRMLAQTMGCAEKDVPLQWDELGKPSVEKDGVYSRPVVANRPRVWNLSAYDLHPGGNLSVYGKDFGPSERV